MGETVPSVRYVKFDTKRCFGVELEVNRRIGLEALVMAVRAADPKRHCIGSSHYQQDQGNDYWHCKFDRSCGDRAAQGGWEVASYKASGAAQLVKIADMGAALSAAGAAVNDNCGYHVHVEIADFLNAQAANLVANWMRLEKVVAEMLPKSRRNNSYCQFLSDVKLVQKGDLVSPADFWARVRPASFDHAERRTALNMCNYALGSSAKRTAEFRLPEGTLDPKEIKNWARLFIHFVCTQKKATWAGTVEPVGDLKSAAVLLGLHGEDPFLLLSQGLYETKTWFFERIIKFSAKKALKAEAQDFLSRIVPPEQAKPKPKPEPPKKKVRAPGLLRPVGVRRTSSGSATTGSPTSGNDAFWRQLQNERVATERRRYRERLARIAEERALNRAANNMQSSMEQNLRELELEYARQVEREREREREQRQADELFGD